ncbi:MAG: hypothetical protein K940chlam3_00338 [Chlamydiae bacterium]|nr:hypothetical protein [Chlamydiota bacterium]
MAVNLIHSVTPKIPELKGINITGNDIIDTVTEVSKPIFGAAGSAAATVAISVGIGLAVGAGLTSVTSATLAAAPVLIPVAGVVAAIAGAAILSGGAKVLLPKLGINLGKKLF